ncbi:MAG: EF-hand domain-containing protein [Gammaproteobacteria bacterium]|nr:EF-hand domain-containing protein [Gammaproteobacteria bacterium]
MKKSQNKPFKKQTLTLLSAHICSSIIITSLLFTHNLQAEPLPSRGPIPFYIYDINSNGFISQDEFHTIRGQRMEYREAQGFPMKNMASEPNFKEFDTDKNGQLSQDELSKGQQKQRQKRWEARQVQGMGMRQGQRRSMCPMNKMPQFENFDLDKDGLLTPEEFNHGMQQHMQNKRTMMQGQGMGMSQNQSRGNNRGRNMPKFEDFDGNNDGMISEQELIEGRSMRISNRIQQGYQMRNTPNITSFQEIDTNADGNISPEEFSTQQQKHRMERQNPQ